MSDITKCVNNECPLKENCYRYKAVPDTIQSYADFQFNDDGSCDYFYDMQKKMNKISIS